MDSAKLSTTFVDLDEHKRLLEPKPDHPRYPHSIFGYRNRVRLVKRLDARKLTHM